MQNNSEKTTTTSDSGHKADPIEFTRSLAALSDKRIDILRRIKETGSISEAARASGVSYKAAWQALETLENLAGGKLVEKLVGGNRGGGTTLTVTGEQILKIADRIAQARSEVLRWNDCDFENNEIFINHNVIYRFRDYDGWRFRLTTPKTNAGNRVVPMLSEVREALLQERENQKRFKLKFPTIDGYSNFVFLNREQNLHNPMTINRAIKRIIRDHNRDEVKLAEKEKREPLLIRDFSVHNLRHTFCTRFCENETNLKVIQEIMGHSDISTTMNIYAEATA